MKKSVFVNLLVGVVFGVLFALGMCMCLLPEWNAFQPGVICTGVGFVVLVVQAIVAVIRSGKKITINWKLTGKVLFGVLGSLVLGLGMCMHDPGVEPAALGHSGWHCGHHPAAVPDPHVHRPEITTQA